MPPAVIGAIIVGGAGIAKAEIDANSASKASQTAAAGTTDALNYTKQKDAQTRADAITAQNANYAQQQAKDARLQPYLQAGAGASASLRSGLGLPAVSIAPLPPPPVFTSTFNPTPAATPPTPMPVVGSVSRVVNNVQTQMANAQNPGAATTTAPNTQGTMVSMRAPDGSINSVPASAVSYYTQKGATVVHA